MVYTWLLCRICSGASKIYVCAYNAKYRLDACEIHARGHFLEIFGVLIKFFFPFAPSSPHIRGEEMANANVSGERSASQGNNRDDRRSSGKKNSTRPKADVFSIH